MCAPLQYTTDEFITRERTSPSFPTINRIMTMTPAQLDEEWRRYLLDQEMKRLKKLSADGRAIQKLRRMGELTKWRRLVG
jgi:hypothetical protein